MSSIPNSAMPRAGDIHETEGQSAASESKESTSAFSQFADKAREYPKTAIAAGAVVAAGVVAATLTARSPGRSKGKRSRSRTGGKKKA